jgi:hypothetical protein
MDNSFEDCENVEFKYVTLGEVWEKKEELLFYHQL